MQRIVLGILICIVLTACGGQEGPPLLPPSEETLAAQKFNNSNAVKSLKAKGVEISCYDVCTGVTDSFLQLLANNVDGLVKLNKKVEKFEVRAKSDHYFTSPFGNYIMFLPLDLDQKTLDLADQIFDKIFALESKVSFKAFPKSLDHKNLDAIDVLIENAEHLDSYEFNKLQLISSGTVLSNKGSAELNIDSVIGSIDTVFTQLDLFVDIYKKIPNIDVGIIGTDDKIYKLLNEVLQRWHEVAKAITRQELTRLVFIDEKEDYYFSMSFLGTHSISFEASQSVDDILEVINYEMYLLDLGIALKTKVIHKNLYVSYKMYPNCSEKIPQLKAALMEKSEKIDVVYVDNGINSLGISVPITPTRFEDGKLSINCYEDSVEAMLEVIKGI